MKNSIGLVVALAVLLSACTFTISYDEGSGVIVREVRAVSDFEEVSFTGIGELEIRMGESASLEIEGEDNILPQIVTNVEDGQLEISFDNDRWETVIRPTRSIRYYLTVVDLTELNLSGLGDVQLISVEAPNLVITLSGAGRVRASGEVDDLTVIVTGAGSFEGADLRSEKVSVNLSGAGSATVWADEFLDVNISGLGSVAYYGRPEVRRTVTGLGSLEDLGDR